MDILNEEICIDEEKKENELLSKIEIPMIQRDYAQGRENEKDVRNRFLSSIFEALEKRENLILDFVYGSINKEVRFLLLDGQQRLTTLFLLYWYIASRELSTVDKKEIMTSLSKFTYATRDSASSFCENLVKKTNTDESGFFEETPQKRLKNLPWFFLSYEKDPTIKSMFTMLDAIHEKYNESKNKPLFDGLQNITFYVLFMHDFKLTDELYVKMNARGKQLTGFENFKADLIKWMKVENNPYQDIYTKETKLDGRKISYHMSISQKMDNVWAKFFWKYSKTEEDEKIPDRFLLNFFNRYLLNLFIVESQDSPEGIQKDDTFEYFYGDEGNDAELAYHSFEKYQTIFEKKNVIHNIEKCLDCFSKHYEPTIRDIAKAPWGNTWDFFQTELDNLSQRVIFLAITLFIEKNDINDNFPITQFKQWMRVVWNIVENTGNRITEIIPAMRLINELSEHTKDIYAFLSDENSTIKSEASEEQIAEERQKAKLIKDDDKWEEELIIAEKHPYFSGQIYFLLHIAGENLQQFISYRDKAIKVFKENLGHNDDYYFHRALLTLAMDREDSDYFIEKSNNNKYSFCEKEDIKNYMLRYNDDDFYYKLIRSLLDVVSSETADEDIENIVKSVKFNDEKWQTFFITTPHCFKYCGDKLITWEDEGQKIYLLSKSRMSSKHVELRTYYLWKEWIEQKKEKFHPFDDINYPDVLGISEYPCAVLDSFSYEGTPFKLDISFQNGCYQFSLKSSDGESNDKLLKIKKKLRSSIEIEGDNECLDFPSCSTVKEAKKQIEEICELLKSNFVNE